MFDPFSSKKEFDESQFNHFVKMIRELNSISEIIKGLEDFNNNVELERYDIPFNVFIQLKKELKEKFKNDPQFYELKGILKRCIGNFEYNLAEEWNSFRYAYLEFLDEEYASDDYKGKIVQILKWLTKIERKSLFGINLNNKEYRKKCRMLFETELKLLETDLKYFEKIDEYSGNIPKSNKSTPLKKNLTNKEQVILLNEIGFFALGKIKSLTTKQKGNLVASLLNKNSKNTEEYIRYCNPDGGMSSEDNPYRHKNYVSRIIELLDDLGIK